ncbi:MAG: InlB B-repeat-containing protein, partial [Bacteroidota bacterium]
MTGQESFSMTGDPAFVNPTGSSATVDLHINSNANPIPVGYDAGTPIASVTTDFDGSARSATTPDLGAHEYAIFRSLTASAGPNGSIAPNGVTNVNYGASQSYSIIPDAGYAVQDVLVDGVSVGAVSSYTFSNVTANHTISATFVQNTFTITSSAGANGSISPTPTAVVSAGGNQTFVVTPDAGYHVADVLVDNASVGAVTSYTFTNVSANHTIAASFAINTYPLNTAVVGNGSVGKVPDLSAYDHGTVVTVTAIPATGWSFSGWSGDASGSTNPLNVTMEAAKNITASFMLNTYTLSVSATNGSVAKNPDQLTYNHGSTVDLTATPDVGYHFRGWSGDGSGSTNPLTVMMDGNKNIVGNFAINTYTISATSGADGSVTPSGNTLVNYGGSLSYTITPDPGYQVIDVLVDGVSVGAVTSYSFTNVTGNHTISATFNLNTFTISSSAGSGGSISPSPSVIVNYGGSQTFTITPDAGYNIADVLVDNVSVGAATSYSFNTVAANHTISASFAILSYPLNIAVVGSGSVAKAPNQATYDHGIVVSLAATPVVGWSFAGWSGDATGSANPLNVTMDAAKSITATFTIDAYTLTINATNGTVAKNPDQPTYTHSSVVQLTASPPVGYSFTGWSGDASGTTNPLAVTMDANKNITANFVLNALATITGTVQVNSVGLANVVVKLLDSDGNFIPAFPAITTSSAGTYSFTDVPSGFDYQVMIVEPLGYSVDENPKLLTLTPVGVTVNFTLTIEVIANRARGVAYWKHQFDEHRCRRRHCELTEAQLLSYIAAVHEHYDPHFSIFQNLTTIDQWGDIFSVGGRSTMRDRAKKQLAALLMNLVSLKIGQYTIVTRDSRTAGDVLTYVSILITDNTPANDQLARTLAAKVNNRDVIAAGVVPASNVLYKGRGNQITWTFDIPVEYGLS